MNRDWLVVIDMQPAFSRPDSPWFIPTMAVVAGRIERLVPAFADRVVFTRFVPPARPFGSWIAYYQSWPFALTLEAAGLWELDPPWTGRPAIASHTFSKWNAALRARCDGAAAVLCGVSTDCCVLMTALAAVDDGAAVRVVADACAAKSPGIQDLALRLMAGRAPQLQVTTVEEELRCISA